LLSLIVPSGRFGDTPNVALKDVDLTLNRRRAESRSFFADVVKVKGTEALPGSCGEALVANSHFDADSRRC
jgi:hypothetical protein